jgi:hypothetical protein
VGYENDACGDHDAITNFNEPRLLAVRLNIVVQRALVSYSNAKVPKIGDLSAAEFYEP